MCLCVLNSSLSTKAFYSKNSIAQCDPGRDADGHPGPKIAQNMGAGSVPLFQHILVQDFIRF